MKKVLVLLLALVMLVSITACGAETVVVYVTADPNATEAPQESKGEGNNQDAANNKDNVAEGIEIVKQLQAIATIFFLAKVKKLWYTQGYD